MSKTCAQHETLRPLAVSILDAVQMTGISRASLYRAIATKKLVARKHGGRTVLLVEEVERFLHGLPTAGPGWVGASQQGSQHDAYDQREEHP